MTPAPAGPDVERFRAAIAHRLGLSFDSSRTAFLSDLLAARLASTGQDPATYLSDCERGRDPEESRALARELTVGETYFLRNAAQFRALAESALPALVRQRDGGTPLTVLSAGCSSGEEAYSLAIILRECVVAPDSATIHAIDVNDDVLEKARAARYTAWSLRETPEEMVRRWFRRDGPDVILAESIRQAVTFEQRNLVLDDPDFWRPGRYDVIFCRNVLMYFTPEIARTVIQRIATSLRPRGYLFLGHAETLRGLSTQFQVCHTHGAFYYRHEPQQEESAAQDQPRTRRPARSPSPAQDQGRAASAAAGSESASAATVQPDRGWVDAIRVASEHVRRLTETERHGRRRQAPPDSARPGWDLRSALELLGRERFVDALGLVAALPPEAADDPDVLLLKAALLTHSGRLDQAEEACHRLLGLDPCSAGARYLLALCREGSGQDRWAVEQDRMAIHIDAAFAMPHVHLGLLHRRSGDVHSARQEFALALELLPDEEESRILLFGGGFTREVLIAMCRAETLSTGAVS